MRHLMVVLLGLVVGAAAAIAFIYYNPFASRISLSPISVSDQPQIILNYSAVAADSIIVLAPTARRLPAPALRLQPPIR